MGYYYCEDCDRRMDSGEICGGCYQCGNEDHLCDRCTSTRHENPSCAYCKKGCSNCKCVGDDGLDGAENDIGFEKCYCEDCPMNYMFDAAEMCSGCFEDKAKKLGCADGCEVWIVAECGHTTCTALQSSEETPEGECPNCYSEKENAEKKAAEAVYNAKQAKAEVKDAPIIKKLLLTVTSESAKAILTKWVSDHPKACAAKSVKRHSKRKR